VDIENAVVLITGASSGIGEATARAAAAAGARVVLAARREERIRELAEQLPGARAVACDVTDVDQLAQAVQTAVDAYGRVDVLVNNAGQGLHVPLEDVDPADFRAVLDLNVVAPLAAMQAVLPVMRRQGAGSIVNVSSGTTLVVRPGAGAYAASKAALNMLSSVARLELADAGIAVSTVYPFITATEFHSSLRAGELRAPPVSAETPRELRPQRPEQVAEVILELIRTGAERADLVPTRFGGTYEG
jgi:NAD(P)-dependent dehydrogenase (short-subunit alcohol dehydrogenase family)